MSNLLKVDWTNTDALPWEPIGIGVAIALVTFPGHRILASVLAAAAAVMLFGPSTRSPKKACCAACADDAPPPVVAATPPYAAPGLDGGTILANGAGAAAFAP